MTSMRMRPLNAVWLMMDSADTPMHVGVLATFQKPRNAPEDYLSRWADQMREFQQPAAPWGYRLDRGRGPIYGYRRAGPHTRPCRLACAR